MKLARTRPAPTRVIDSSLTRAPSLAHLVFRERGPSYLSFYISSMARFLVFFTAMLLLCLEANAFTGGVYVVEPSLAAKGLRLESRVPMERNLGIIGAVRNTWRRAFPAQQAVPSAVRPLASSSALRNAADSGTVNLSRGPLGPFYARLTKISNILTSLFPLWVLSAVVVALVKPATLAWIKGDIITLFVGATMVFTGMTLEVDDFLKILKQPSQVHRCAPRPPSCPHI